MKNASRRTETQQKNEIKFKHCFEDLFDIAHSNALDMIIIDEDKAFLVAQREKGRTGSMSSSVDNVLAKKERKQSERLAKEENRRLKSASEIELLNRNLMLVISSTGTGSSEESEADPG